MYHRNELPRATITNDKNGKGSITVTFPNRVYAW